MRVNPFTFLGERLFLMEDRWGWVTAAVTSVLAAVGALWGVLAKSHKEEIVSAISQYRKFITDQREENDRLRARLSLHDEHMGNQQKLIEQLYVRDARCRADLSYLWERATRAGLDLGPKPDVLRERAADEFDMKTAAQNTSLLKTLDAEVKDKDTNAK